MENKKEEIKDNILLTKALNFESFFDCIIENDFLKAIQINHATTPILTGSVRKKIDSRKN